MHAGCPLTQHYCVGAAHADCQRTLAHSLQGVLHLEPRVQGHHTWVILHSNSQPNSDQTTKRTYKCPSGEKTVIALSYRADIMLIYPILALVPSADSAVDRQDQGLT